MKNRLINYVADCFGACFEAACVIYVALLPLVVLLVVLWVVKHLIF